MPIEKSEIIFEETQESSSRSKVAQTKLDSNLEIFSLILIVGDKFINRIVQLR